MEVVGRDKINQSGIGNKITIKNAGGGNDSSKWVVRVIWTVVSGVIVGGIIYYFNWN